MRTQNVVRALLKNFEKKKYYGCKGALHLERQAHPLPLLVGPVDISSTPSTAASQSLKTIRWVGAPGSSVQILCHVESKHGPKSQAQLVITRWSLCT
jgi:hypothetical protein